MPSPVRKALARRDVFYIATGPNQQHPAVVVEVLADRIVVASGTGADEPSESTSVLVDGQAAALMGLNKLTRFYKMHVIVWNETPPIEALVIAKCIGSLFPKIERLVEEAAAEHALGQRVLKSLPRGSAVPVDLIAGLTAKKK